MKKKKLDWIIRMLREEMVANAPGESGGFSSSANPKGPVAGRDGVMGKVARRKRYIYQKGLRKKLLLLCLVSLLVTNLLILDLVDNNC